MNLHSNDSFEADEVDESEFHEIQSLLAGLPLRAPTAALDRRVGRLFRRSDFFQQLRSFSLGAAAMLVVSVGVGSVLMGQQNRKPKAPELPGGSRPIPLLENSGHAANPSTPVLVSHTESHTASDGVVRLTGDAPLHLLRRQSVQQAWLIDPKTGKRLSVTIPREQVVVQRVQTF